MFHVLILPRLLSSYRCLASPIFLELVYISKTRPRLLYQPFIKRILKNSSEREINLNERNPEVERFQCRCTGQEGVVIGDDIDMIMIMTVTDDKKNSVM